MMAKKVQLKVTRTRSTIGCKQDQIKTIAALGLHKIHSTKVFDDSPGVRGMIAKVSHLVAVEEIK